MQTKTAPALFERSELLSSAGQSARSCGNRYELQRANLGTLGGLS